MRLTGICSLVALCMTSTLFAGDAGRLAIGRPAAEFTLKDYRGKTVSMSDYKSSQLVVLAVLGTECPLAKQYAIKLQKVADEYRDRGLVVLGIDANRQDSLTEIAAFARTNSIEFPIVKDLNQTVIESLGATRTPEVFLLDAQRNVRYHGRVDDQYAVGGKSRKTATREDLKVAINEVLDGKPVSVTETSAIGCLIGRAREPQKDSPVTYSNQISRLLQKNCVECHRPGEIAPFSLTEYQEVAGWADMIVEVTRSRQMPPWHASPDYGHFANERRLTDDEIDLFKRWAEAGAPEGGRSDLPTPRTFVDGWQLPREPDSVVWMADEAAQVPAEGTVNYRYFTVDPGFTEDKWISAAEVVPGNRGVVHHVIVFMTTDLKSREDERQTVTAYVPGYRIRPYPQGTAKRIPKGAKFIFQMHYTPNGVACEDRTKVGLVFTDPNGVEQEVRTAALINRKFVIEPEKDDQKFESRPINLPADMKLLSLSPHMHLRGKSFRYEMSLPDGSKEILLDVPHYDFNWQTAYKLNEPRTIPQGAKLMAYASFDNSSNNLANPDPSKTVTWGEQSWEEMFLGYFDLAVPKNAKDPAMAVLAAVANSRDPQEIVAKVFEILDRNKDDKLSRDEVGQARKAIFDKMDANADDLVTKEELTKALPELAKLLGR